MKRRVFALPAAFRRRPKHRLHRRRRVATERRQHRSAKRMTGNAIPCVSASGLFGWMLFHTGGSRHRQFVCRPPAWALLRVSLEWEGQEITTRSVSFDVAILGRITT